MGNLLNHIRAGLTAERRHNPHLYTTSVGQLAAHVDDRLAKLFMRLIEAYYQENIVPLPPREADKKVWADDKWTGYKPVVPDGYLVPDGYHPPVDDGGSCPNE